MAPCGRKLYFASGSRLSGTWVVKEELGKEAAFGRKLYGAFGSHSEMEYFSASVQFPLIGCAGVSLPSGVFSFASSDLVSSDNEQNGLFNSACAKAP